MQTPEQCSGCVRQIKGKCFAFTDPFDAWQDGCWAYTNDVQRVYQELMDAYNYSVLSDKDSTKDARRILREYAKDHDLIGGSTI